MRLCHVGRRTGERVVLSTYKRADWARDSLPSGILRLDSEGLNRQSNPFHLPVMADEVVRGLMLAAGGVYVDGTLGQGGHSLALLGESSGAPAALVIGIDLDDRSVADAAQRLSEFGSRFRPLQGNYASMDSLVQGLGMHHVDGVLLDLGFSSRQVDQPGYGLSFQSDEPLDMRYDSQQALTAAELVNEASETELADLFRRLGEEPRARAIARAIVTERRSSPIRSTGELAEVVSRVAGRGRGHRIHPATRVFQALRISVNGELENLQAGLDAALSLLRPGGRLAVISYHSLEDRIVKNYLAHESAECVCPPGLPQCICGKSPALSIVNRRVIRPTADEIARNPRSRSARLRLATRIQAGNQTGNQAETQAGR